MNRMKDIEHGLDTLLTSMEELKTAQQYVDTNKRELMEELLSRGMVECFTLNLNKVRRAVRHG